MKKPENLIAVVLCKECFNYVKDNERKIVYCKSWGGLNGITPDDYCSRGRKKNEQSAKR